MTSSTSTEQAASLPTIHVVSDSIGATASAVAKAAAAQFGVNDPKIRLLAKVQEFSEIKAFLDQRRALYQERYGNDRILVFYTLVNPRLREQYREYVQEHPNTVSVDLMSNALDAISQMTGEEPSHVPGRLRTADAGYFRRIEAVEFTIAHDDGRNPQDLTKADIVLIGVSRTSKTPLSVYLSQQGYKVANVPLDPSSNPPSEIFQVERTRLFGLMTSPDVLLGIRQRRIGSASAVAPRYADLEYIYEDLEKARSLMRRLGCIVIHTENRAIEETAQDIIRYYERSHPSFLDDVN